MDALEFLMERNRLCGSYRGCVGCPFGAAECVVRDMTSEHTCKRIVTAVEQWSKEHPRKMVGVLRKSHFDGYKPTLKNEMEAKEDGNVD